MFSFPEADQTYAITLECDPGHKTGDALSIFTVRPQTKAIINDATEAAGVIPHAGQMLMHRVASAAFKTAIARAKEIRPDDGYSDALDAMTPDERTIVGLARMVTESEELSKLDDHERSLIRDAKAWSDRQQVELISRVVVWIDGGEVKDASWVEKLTPASLRDDVIAELCAVTKGMASLSPKECSNFAARYGSSMTQDDADGSASTA